MNYKVGDKVRIVERIKDETDYPFCFTDGMASLRGKVFTIKHINETRNSSCSINGDYHLYELKGTTWSWHSSMFELAESSKVDDTTKSSELKVGDTVQVIAKGFEEEHPLLFPSMKKYIGKTFKVIEFNYHSDGNHTYRLDGDVDGWYWPISALEKIEFPNEIEIDEIEVGKDTEDFLRKASSDDSGLIETSDCEISASIYTDSIKIIL